MCVPSVYPAIPTGDIGVLSPALRLGFYCLFDMAGRAPDKRTIPPVRLSPGAAGSQAEVAPGAEPELDRCGSGRRSHRAGARQPRDSVLRRRMLVWVTEMLECRYVP